MRLSMQNDHQKKRRRGDNESLVAGDRKESSDGAESNEDCETCIICMQVRACRTLSFFNSSGAESLSGRQS